MKTKAGSQDPAVPGKAAPNALAVDAGPRVSKEAVEIRPFKSPPPGRAIGLVWRECAPFPETFEGLAATLKARLLAEVAPV